jgi:hypothetical protein
MVVAAPVAHVTHATTTSLAWDSVPLDPDDQDPVVAPALFVLSTAPEAATPDHSSAQMNESVGAADRAMATAWPPPAHPWSVQISVSVAAIPLDVSAWALARAQLSAAPPIVTPVIVGAAALGTFAVPMQATRQFPAVTGDANVAVTVVPVVPVADAVWTRDGANSPPYGA